MAVWLSLMQRLSIEIRDAIVDEQRFPGRQGRLGRGAQRLRPRRRWDADWLLQLFSPRTARLHLDKRDAPLAAA